MRMTIMATQLHSCVVQVAELACKSSPSSRTLPGSVLVSDPLDPAQLKCDNLNSEFHGSLFQSPFNMLARKGPAYTKQSELLSARSERALDLDLSMNSLSLDETKNKRRRFRRVQQKA